MQRNTSKKEARTKMRVDKRCCWNGVVKSANGSSLSLFFSTPLTLVAPRMPKAQAIALKAAYPRISLASVLAASQLRRSSSWLCSSAGLPFRGDEVDKRLNHRPSSCSDDQWEPAASSLDKGDADARRVGDDDDEGDDDDDIDEDVGGEESTGVDGRRLGTSGNDSCSDLRWENVWRWATRPSSARSSVAVRGEMKPRQLPPGRDRDRGVMIIFSHF